MEKINNWEILEDMNDDDGSPSCWVKTINSERYGKFIYITLNCDGNYNVEVEGYENDTITLKNFKSLNGAKRWATLNIK